MQIKAGDLLWFRGDREVRTGCYRVVEYNGRNVVVLEAGPINLWTVSIHECRPVAHN